MDKSWQNYEEVATYLLNQFASTFGLGSVEGKQIIAGTRSGTRWEIDAKGIKEDERGFVIIECRRYTKAKQSQEKLAALAYRIIDTGASGGIIVSPLGVQEGAAMIAGAENVKVVHLNENSTTSEYILQFLNKIMIGVKDTISLTDEVEVVVVKKS
jgi:hypothetical protein